MRRSCAFIVLGAGLVCAPASAGVVYSGFLATPPTSGLVGGGNWAPPAAGMGFMVTWNVSQNMDGTWHYEYILTNQGGGPLTPGASHGIFQLSENISPGDIYNFGGHFAEAEFGTFGPGPNNPGFPVGESIFGIKIDFTNGNPTMISFDSNREPMWGDFYSKGGTNSFAYNVHLGVEVANPNDYTGTPVDASGAPLFKILVPDTIIPTPGSMALLGVAALVAVRRRR